MKLLLISIFVFFFLYGCDLFKTRDPASPTQSTSGFQPPVTPEIVLDNFKSAIQEHNVDNYLRCFVDTTVSDQSFIFGAAGNYQGFFLGWNLENERRYFQNLGTPINSVPYINFSNLKQQNRTSASIEYTMDYFLIYPHSRSGLTKQVQGYMHLYLEADTKQQWSIYRWEDTKTITDSTWSYFKYNLAS